TGKPAASDNNYWRFSNMARSATTNVCGLSRDALRAGNEPGLDAPRERQYPPRALSSSCGAPHGEGRALRAREAPEPLAPPALADRGHRCLARRHVAVRGRASFPLRTAPLLDKSPPCSFRFKHGSCCLCHYPKGVEQVRPPPRAWLAMGRYSEGL